MLPLFPEVISLYDCGMIFYIQFIDWFFTCLNLYVVISNYNNIAGMFVGVVLEVIFLYDCSVNIVIVN